MKRQLSDLNENAGKPTLDVMRERLNHLATIESIQNTTEPEFSRWADTRLDRWLVDWSLRNGKEWTARRIAKDKDIEVRGSVSGGGVGLLIEVLPRSERP